MASVTWIQRAQVISHTANHTLELHPNA